MNEIPMDKILRGERAEVVYLKPGGDIRRRLLEIGFSPGSEIKCIGSSPFGDPRAYFVKGAVFAIRNKDAETVIVRCL